MKIIFKLLDLYYWVKLEVCKVILIIHGFRVRFAQPGFFFITKQDLRSYRVLLWYLISTVFILMTNELVNEKITSTCTAIFHLNLKAKKIWFILKNDLIDKQESRHKKMIP